MAIRIGLNQGFLTGGARNVSRGCGGAESLRLIRPTLLNTKKLCYRLQIYKWKITEFSINQSINQSIYLFVLCFKMKNTPIYVKKSF